MEWPSNNGDIEEDKDNKRPKREKEIKKGEAIQEKPNFSQGKYNTEGNNSKGELSLEISEPEKRSNSRKERSHRDKDDGLDHVPEVSPICNDSRNLYPL
jgi:hypothetical protein